MPSARNRLFEELGLLAETEQQLNPYSILGLDATFAQDLLRDDTSGEMIRLTARALYRVLSHRYHPDKAETGDPERFKSIAKAYERVSDASPADLSRWSKTEHAAPQAKLDRVRAESEAAVGRATELVRTNMQLGRHPLHFSQLEWSQGILLRRNRSTLLARQSAREGIEVALGQQLNYETTGQALGMRKQVVDFNDFLIKQLAFGLEPGSQIVMYANGEGRFSILAPDLSFVMDITDAVKLYRKQSSRLRGEERAERVGSDYWSRAIEPALLVTHVPSIEGLQQADPGSQFLVFSDSAKALQKGRDAVQSLSMEIAGTVGSVDTFRRLRYSKAAGAAVLLGTRAVAHYFDMASISARRLVEQGIDYSPLMTPGNALLLYSNEHHTPVVTDATVVGMIGNNAQAF